MKFCGCLRLLFRRETVHFGHHLQSYRPRQHNEPHLRQKSIFPAARNCSRFELQWCAKKASQEAHRHVIEKQNCPHYSHGLCDRLGQQLQQRVTALIRRTSVTGVAATHLGHRRHGGEELLFGFAPEGSEKKSAVVACTGGATAREK